MQTSSSVLIVGGGIGGLTLALQLERRGIAATVLEAAPELRPLGVGINILPHASRELCILGLQDRLDAIGVRTSCSVFYNRFGQLIHADPAGVAAGYQWPQYSIHRGELQVALVNEWLRRGGENGLVLDAQAVGVEDDGDVVRVTTQSQDGTTRTWTGDVVIGCDGVHSAIRKTLHPEEQGLLYSGYTMFRGTTRMKPFLDGASMVRAGWLETGKMVIYPITNFEDGTQLINWVAELEAPQMAGRDWSRIATGDDYLEPFADWTFDWLDVPAMMSGASQVFEYPMMDQDPLPFWTRGGITLLGDAAHPMVPRGSNGAGQAIVDTRVLADALVEESTFRDALQTFEQERLPATADVVRLNRANPPDALLREVYERTGDRPFDDVTSVISREEILALLENYRTVTGSSVEALRAL
jgi:2-polyprenyl-6-methoxyphenol hydroxylase-like FAD-dependent oxidoreductase